MATYSFDSRSGRFAHEADPLHRLRRRPVASIGLRVVQWLLVAGIAVVGLFALAFALGIALVGGLIFFWRARSAQRRAAQRFGRENSGNSFVVRRVI